MKYYSIKKFSILLDIRGDTVKTLKSVWNYCGHRHTMNYKIFFFWLTLKQERKPTRKKSTSNSTLELHSGKCGWLWCHRLSFGKKQPPLCVSLGMNKDSIKPAWKAWGCESCFTSLPLPTGSYLTLLGLTGPHLALTGPYWALTVPYLALLGLTGPYLALLSLILHLLN